uniref:Uncharacterized protein n=1 Tax=Arundo donax TaxID=35708 RepID=A0A0A8YQL4_ARUDO
MLLKGGICLWDMQNVCFICRTLPISLLPLRHAQYVPFVRRIL